MSHTRGDAEDEEGMLAEPDNKLEKNVGKTDDVGMQDRKQAYMHTGIDTYTHIHICTHIHTYTYAHVHTPTHTSQARYTHTQTTCSHTRPVTTKARAGAREGRELRARVPHSSRWRERS